MGLAASQARFLGITARKSNIEYEGQQVNQQRTALAEEVNALYSKLLSLKVPVAPDATEFFETNYSFNLTNTQNYDGSYIIKNYYENADGTYYVNAERTYTKNVAEGTVLGHSSISKTQTLDEDGNPVYDESGLPKYTYTLNTTNGSYTLVPNAQNSESMIALINQTYGEGTIKSDKLYSYVDGTGKTHYMDKEVVENADQYPALSSYISTDKSIKESVIFEKAHITFDKNNRISNIYAEDPTTGTTLFNNTDVDTKREYNSDEYDAALRDYTMSKDEYDKAVADLNAQTKSLQQEDKVLELRLNQIDTEQSALQTELDAVKAVLDKNVEKTFNTFS